MKIVQGIMSIFHVRFFLLHQKHTFVDAIDAKVIILEYFCGLYCIILTLLTKKVKSRNPWFKIYNSKQEFFYNKILAIAPFTFYIKK